MTKIVTGETATADWKNYDWKKDKGIMVKVDTSAGEFTQTPHYLVSLYGNSLHWKVSGVNSIYGAGPEGFEVYLCWSDNDGPLTSKHFDPLRADKAEGWGWYLKWTGIET